MYPTSLLSASSMMSDEVKNPAGENLGEIKEFMIDTATGRIEYAVLSFGGFLGLGDKYFAVPWSALQVDREEKCLVLNVAKERLKDAPGFDKDNWPNMADPQFKDRIYGHYGIDYRRAA